MFIFSNLAMSLDGKIATQGRESFVLGSEEDRVQMDRLRLEADAILMGAGTLRTFQKPFLLRLPGRQPLNVIVSSRLEGISPTWPFFKSDAIERLLLVSAPVSATKLKPFEKTSEIVMLKKETARNPLARQIIAELSRRGIERLLIEGGGELMWSFASRNLIDEYHVTLTPRILGGRKSPTLVDGPGFTPSQSLCLKLMQCRPVGDELYLTYRKSR